MAEEQIDRFYERLDRIAEQRRAGEGLVGPVSAARQASGKRGGRAGTAAPLRPLAIMGGMAGAALRGIAMLALLALALKAGLMSAMGLPAYEARLADVTEGRALDPVETRVAALLVPDPVSLRLREGLLVAGVPEGWLAGGSPVPQERGRSLPKRIQIGTGQADVPQLGIAQR